MLWKKYRECLKEDKRNGLGNNHSYVVIRFYISEIRSENNLKVVKKERKPTKLIKEDEGLQ